MSTNSDIRIFSEQLGRWRRKTHERLDKAKQALARKVLGKLVARSPVLTGSYCLSHKVGIGTPDLTFEKRLLNAPSRVSITSKALITGFNKIGAAGYDDAIYITNRVPHARFVEYLGWITEDGIKPAYQVYGLTKAEMRLVAKSIVKAYENVKL